MCNNKCHDELINSDSLLKVAFIESFFCIIEPREHKIPCIYVLSQTTTLTKHRIDKYYKTDKYKCKMYILNSFINDNKGTTWIPLSPKTSKHFYDLSKEQVNQEEFHFLSSKNEQRKEKQFICKSCFLRYFSNLIL